MRDLTPDVPVVQFVAIVAMLVAIAAYFQRGFNFISFKEWVDKLGHVDLNTTSVKAAHGDKHDHTAISLYFWEVTRLGITAQWLERIMGVMLSVVAAIVVVLCMYAFLPDAAQVNEPADSEATPPPVAVAPQVNQLAGSEAATQTASTAESQRGRRPIYLTSWVIIAAASLVTTFRFRVNQRWTKLRAKAQEAGLPHE